MKNKYAHRSHISEAKIRHIVRCFAADLTARQAVDLTGVNRNTANRFFRALRERIRQACEHRRPTCAGANSIRLPEPDGRASGKDCGDAFVFGIFEQDGQVYTEVVARESNRVLRGLIRGRIDVSAVVNSDEWPGYHGLVDVSHGHFRVDHRHGINGMEGFWGLAKVRLAKFRGVPAQTFHLHLKETEWRYNYRDCDKYTMLLAYLREEPVN